MQPTGLNIAMLPMMDPILVVELIGLLFVLPMVMHFHTILKFGISAMNAQAALRLRSRLRPPLTSSLLPHLPREASA